MAITEIILAGDSLTAGTIGLFAASEGGQGNFDELLGARLGRIPGIGPEISSGIRTTGVGAEFLPAAYEWSWTGSWTVIQSTDLWDKLPYGILSPPTTYPSGFYANGASNIAKYTIPAEQSPVIGFALYWIDYTNGGDWSYRIDGTGSWIAMGQNLANDNKLCKFYVGTPVTSYVEIRAGGAVSGDVGCCPAGIELYFYDPLTTTTGVIVHNIGINGQSLAALTATTSGDHMAFFDSVKLGTGNPLPIKPNICTMMHINDLSLGVATWQANMLTFRNRVAATGAKIIFMCPWECLPGSYDITVQASMRQATRDAGAARYLDFFDEWYRLGFTNNASQSRYLYDSLHLNQAGYIDVADRLYWFLRKHFLQVGSGSTPFTLGSSSLGGTDTLGGTPGTYTPIHNTTGNTGKTSFRTGSGVSIGSAAW